MESFLVRLLPTVPELGSAPSSFKALSVHVFDVAMENDTHSINDCK